MGKSITLAAMHLRCGCRIGIAAVGFGNGIIWHFLISDAETGCMMMLLYFLVNDARRGDHFASNFYQARKRALCRRLHWAVDSGGDGLRGENILNE